MKNVGEGVLVKLNLEDETKWRWEGGAVAVRNSIVRAPLRVGS
jgi:hypothetical protein